MKGFVHLHVHSEYSLLDGACRIDKLVARAKELNFPALAITDHGVLYGVIDFYKAAQEKDLKPIIGCEAYIAPASRFEKITHSAGKDVYNHIVLLAENNVGYRNLVKLVTKAHLEGFYYKPRIDKELLLEHKEGLIILTGCLDGEIPEKIINGKIKEAWEIADWYRQVFGRDHFYLELQYHGLPEQATVNRELLRIARDLNLKVIATNDVHYIQKEHSHAHDVLLCIGTQTTLSDPKRIRYPEGQFYLRSAEEMAAIFAEVPSSLSNTLEIAERSHVTFEFGRLRYPKFDAPNGKNNSIYLRELLLEGLYYRYKIKAHLEGYHFVIDEIEDPWLLPFYAKIRDQARMEGKQEPPLIINPSGQEIYEAAKQVIERLEHELDIIEQTNFVSYFLIVDDFVRYGRSKGISCVARGSAAGSLVTYLLQISNIDPIRYDLLFERFLNPERVSPPDIDIDFADDRREEVINYVREKYGADSVAQIITFGTLGARSVIRDVGRAMGLDYNKCDRLAKTIPEGLGITLSEALALSPQLKKEYETDPVTKELIDVALVLEELARNCSVHAAGVVIGDEPLSNIIPLKKDEDGAIVTQYAMGPISDLGLLKMDFLGLKTLSVIRNCCLLIKETRGLEVDVKKIPLDDELTYQLLNRGDTLGVFQLESSGMRELCKKFNVRCLEHIIALIALYRPGPMDLIPEFIARRHGQTPITYDHPLLEPILKETYGIFVYQEQVMQAAQILAGYTLGQADLLRRAMGKKKPEEMAKHRESFIKGCWEKNKIPPEDAERIFNVLEKFAQYGFNKSHAAAYALVAYHTAYLKAHYPVEFYCAMMTNDMTDTDKLSQYIEEVRSKGIEVMPPDINQSDMNFTPVPDNICGKKSPYGYHIRFGLAAIKGIGEAVVKEILIQRSKNGTFKSLQDLCERVDLRTVNRKALEVLIKAGACDSFGYTRASMLEALEVIMTHASKISADRRIGQASLFDVLGSHTNSHSVQIPCIPEWPLHQKLAAEKELLGFYVTGHPLEPYRKFLARFIPHNINDLVNLEDGHPVWVAGVVTTVQLSITKQNRKRYITLTLEDFSGSVQVLCFEEVVNIAEQIAKQNTLIVVGGELKLNEDKPRIFGRYLSLLNEFTAQYAAVLILKITNDIKPIQLNQLKDLIRSYRGKCPVYLMFEHFSGISIVAEASVEFACNPTLELLAKIEEILGEGSWRLRLDLPGLINERKSSYSLSSSI